MQKTIRTYLKQTLVNKFFNTETAILMYSFILVAASSWSFSAERSSSHLCWRSPVLNAQR